MQTPDNGLELASLSNVTPTDSSVYDPEQEELCVMNAWLKTLDIARWLHAFILFLITRFFQEISLDRFGRKYIND